MPHSSRQWFFRAYSKRLAQPKHGERRRKFRQLLTETLERRNLLATLTGVAPLANSHHVSIATDISATFNEAIIPASANPGTLSVRSAQGGLLSATSATVSVSGMTVTFNPSANFFPGDLVQATATSGIQGVTAAVPHVWQFRTATTGSGVFVDSGQGLGDPAANTSSWGVEVGDLDGDGDLDVFMANLSVGNRVYLNNGGGEFVDSGQTLGAHRSRNVTLGDMDGDGDLDAVVANDSGQANRIWQNNGAGIFSEQTFGGNSSRDVKLGDLDADGDLDALVANSGRPNRVYLNNNGILTDSGQTLGNSSSRGLGLGDLDGDGDLDAVVANEDQPQRVWLNDGTGAFSDTGQAFLNALSRGVGLGDLDGDGDLDALITSRDYSNKVWLNEGNGVFVDSGQALGQSGGGSSSLRSERVELGDLDGDGDLDGFVSNNNGQTNRIWVNDGNGIFSDSGQSLDADTNSQNIALGDLDGDGDLDAVIANDSYFGGTNSVGRIWINQNLTPTVTLGLNNSVINEDAGTTTVTASLSAVHSEAVTVDLEITGTATAADDYTASGSQIVIPVGATTGSITITAVQDAVDEPDETIVVDIAEITNGQESGTQQVTATILDDDEPIPVPGVTLLVDTAVIPEAEGIATFTATLSEVTTVPVTIELAISGSAGTTDFVASSSQIIVTAGMTTGTIAVTAIDDDVDEPDETVVVDIVSVTGGSEAGTQQQTTTITDDDEPPVPDVTLSADTTEIAEAAGIATLTVTLSEVTTVPVTVDLEFSGTAAATDYTASATQVVIGPGSTTGSVTATAVQDNVNEPNETVIVDISVTGGNEDGVQQQTITILDDDVPPSFTVTSLDLAVSGFRVEFTNELDASEVNLYDTQNAALGAADVVVTGASSGVVAGFLLVDTSSVTFIKSGGPLAADSYTVTLRSATDGFKDAAAMLLDGNADGIGGDDYVGNFTVAEAPAGARTVSIPDFVRGPGQEVNLPADGTTGIPITISDGDNVRAADLRIAYDPALLEITGATAPAGGSVIVNTTTTPGVAILVFFSSASLPAGSSTFINLQATVPAGDASAIYQGQQVLDVHSVTIGDGNDNEFPVVVDDAHHFATYFADVSGNGRINASDAAQVARFAALIDAGFAASLNADPISVGDISGNGRINAADASRVAQFAALIDVPEIPPVPGGIQITGLANPGPGTVGTTPIIVGPLADPSATGNTAEGVASDFRVVENFASKGSGIANIDQVAVDRMMADLANSVSAEQDELGSVSALERTIDELLSAVD